MSTLNELIQLAQQHREVTIFTIGGGLLLVILMYMFTRSLFGSGRPPAYSSSEALAQAAELLKATSEASSQLAAQLQATAERQAEQQKQPGAQQKQHLRQRRAAYWKGFGAALLLCAATVAAYLAYLHYQKGIDLGILLEN